LDAGGHFLWEEVGHYVSTKRMRELIVKGFPWGNEKNPHFIDGGLLQNMKVKDYPTGQVYWTTGGRDVTFWLAFVWWDRSGDSRPGSHSGFYVQGFGVGHVEEAFEWACTQWPQVVARQKHPLRLVNA
jgi:hypothetical protein